MLQTKVWRCVSSLTVTLERKLFILCNLYSDRGGYVNFSAWVTKNMSIFENQRWNYEVNNTLWEIKHILYNVLQIQ
jgi:hypothetical protein